MATANSGEMFSSDSLGGDNFTSFDQPKPAAPTGQASDNAGAKQGTFYCEACEIDCETALKYHSHCRGALHSSKVAQQTSGNPPTNPPATTEPTEPKVDNADSGNFSCSLCNIRTTGAITFEAHLAGKAHQRKLKLAGLSDSDEPKIRAQAQPLKIILKDAVNERLNLGPALKLLTTPALGLQYMIEIHHEDTTVENRYVCELCDSKCDPRTVTSHIIGTKHRLAYIKKHYPEMMDRIHPGGEKGKKSESTPLIHQCSQEVETKEGRQKMRVQIQVSQYASGPNFKRRGEFLGGPEAKRGAWTGQGYGRGWQDSMATGGGRGRGMNYGEEGRGRSWRTETSWGQTSGRGRGGYSDSGRGRGGYSQSGRGRGGYSESGRGRGTYSESGRGRGSYTDSSWSSGGVLGKWEPVVGRGRGWGAKSSYSEVSESKIPERQDAPGRREQDRLRNVLTALRDFEINNEAEASLALEVSNALTQALLNYRLQTVSAGPKAVSLMKSLSKTVSTKSDWSAAPVSYQSEDYGQGYDQSYGQEGAGGYDQGYDQDYYDNSANNGSYDYGSSYNSGYYATGY